MSDVTPRFLSRRFLVGAVVILVGAIGMPPLTQALIVTFEKHPIDLVLSLDDFDLTALPAFVHDSEVQTVVAVDKWVGTSEWMSEGFRLRDPASPELAELGATLFVTYYSDPRDTIPHTPEVCYRQAGGEVGSISTCPVAIEGLAPGRSPADARLVDVTTGQQRLAVMYLLCHNGRLYHDREEARFAMGWPGDRYTYFSKVEAIVIVPPDMPFETAAEIAGRLLADAVPQLLDAHYPDTSGAATEPAEVAP